MHSFRWLAALGLGLLCASCNLTDRELGSRPVGTPVGGGEVDTLGGWPGDSVSGNLRLFATPGRLKAGHKDRAILTARATDGNGNPVPGRVVTFAASMGTITARDTTDADGVATATYTPVPRNGEVRIKATSQVVDTLSVVGTALQLEGLTVDVEPASRDTLVDNAVPVVVTVLDGDRAPVAGAQVTLSGMEDASGVTDGAGRVRSRVRRDDPGQARLAALALGAGDSTTVGFWSTHPDSRSRTILLFAEPARIPAANGSTTRIKAVVYDGNHNPVAGRAVFFTASHGIISPVDTTDREGAAEAVFQGVSQNVDATVTATVALDDTVRRATATVSLVGLQVEVSPAASEMLIGDTAPLSIRVRDAAGNPMPGVQVSLSGAVQSSVRTGASGTATASATSAQDRAVSVRAAALGGADSARIVFLTSMPTGNAAAKQGVGNMRIFVESSKLRASNTDETRVRVVAFDKFNNPLAGRLVRFTANHGIITASDSTDARGEASATYRSVPLNTDARITATMVVDDSSLAVVTTVTLAGLEVDIRPQASDALLNRQVPVQIRLMDGSGRPVPDATVRFNGNPGIGTTDGDGIFRTSVTSGTEKRVLVTAEALGAADTGHVDFWRVLPVNGGTGDVNSIRFMRIFSSRSQLRADNSDAAQVTVILTNEDNNPAVGEEVRFTSNLGIIGQSARVDSAGRATVTLRAAPVNGTAKVEATAVGRNLSASTDILFSGVTLQLAPDRTELKVGEQAAIEAFLKDASGNAIGGDQATFALAGTGASFDNDKAEYAVTLNPNGRALVRVKATSAGKVTVRAGALNTADSVELTFSNNTLTLSSNRTSLAVGGADQATLTATYVDGEGRPIDNAVISFAANAGTLVADRDTTDSQGRATTVLRSASFSGTATVQANAPTGVATAQVTFLAGAPDSVSLTATADNIAVNGGVATLRAVVRDERDNMVSGYEVNFRILKGPGGGESILKPVVTSNAGVAISQLRSGSVASGYRGVLVEASVSAGGRVYADTTKLTISGAAHLVSVSRPEDDWEKVEGVGERDESVFEYFIGAVVQDINGNMVADGTEVHFSAAVTGMAIYRRMLDHWEGLGSDSASIKPFYSWRLLDLPFEDVNNNRAIDPGIDLDLDGSPSTLRRGEDRNGDGRFDYDAALHDEWYDFNGDGDCDAGVGEPFIMAESVMVVVDLNQDGMRNTSEVIVDRGGAGCTLPPSGDYPFHTWEGRSWLPRLAFRDNEFAVAIAVSAVTKNGVAKTRLRYPRQFAERIFVTVNAEVNGIRDKDGERFILPQMKEED